MTETELQSVLTKKLYSISFKVWDTKNNFKPRTKLLYYPVQQEKNKWIPQPSNFLQAILFFNFKGMSHLLILFIL